MHKYRQEIQETFPSWLILGWVATGIWSQRWKKIESTLVRVQPSWHKNMENHGTPGMKNALWNCASYGWKPHKLCSVGSSLVSRWKHDLKIESYAAKKQDAAKGYINWYKLIGSVLNLEFKGLACCTWSSNFESNHVKPFLTKNPGFTPQTTFVMRIIVAEASLLFIVKMLGLEENFEKAKCWWPCFCLLLKHIETSPKSFSVSVWFMCALPCSGSRPNVHVRDACLATCDVRAEIGYTFWWFLEEYRNECSHHEQPPNAAREWA